MKNCVKCGTAYEGPRCKPCWAAYMRGWCERNVEKKRQYCRDFKTKNPRSYKGSKIKQTFGITMDEYEAMVVRQNGLCAACDMPETAIFWRTRKVKCLAVDHCHATGKIRGLLCNRCNAALGLLGDDAGRVEALLAYLQRQMRSAA